MSKPNLQSAISAEYKTLDSAAHQVLVQGKFLEINQAGKAVDEVWLGLTKTELVISEIGKHDKNTEKTQSAKETKDDGDQTRHGHEGGGLRLRRTLPMKFVRILVIDDRAKRMAVVTSTNTVTFYEMCKPKDDWGRWKHAAAKLHHKHDKYKHRQDEGAFRDSRYLTYPFICRQITDKEVQTDPEPESLSVLDEPSQPVVTYMDELEPIVVQEYQVAMDRVFFGRNEEMMFLCKVGRHFGCKRSDSTIDVHNRRRIRAPRRCSSCPNLWKPPRSVYAKKHNVSYERQFARRKLTKADFSIMEEMLEYRRKQRKFPRVSGEWKTDFTWKWDDKTREASTDLKTLLYNAKDQIERGLEEVQGEIPCPQCGRGRQLDESETPNEDAIQFVSTDDVLEFHAGEIAMQLSVRDRNLLWVLTQSDLTRVMLTVTPNSVQSTNCVALQKMSAWCERVSRLVATEVLDQPNYESCMEALKLFIKVAEFCWVIRNFNSFVNVMRGLQFYSVYRLGVVWEYLQKTSPNICQLYLTMCDTMAELIANLYKLGPRAKRLPMKSATIPWFPALVWRLMNETRHQQAIRMTRQPHTKAIRKPQARPPEGDSETEDGGTEAVPSQEAVPVWLKEYASDMSVDILQEAVDQSEWQIIDSGSSSCESPDEEVDIVDTEAFDSLHKRLSVSEEVESDKPKERRVSIFDTDSDKPKERRSSIFDTDSNKPKERRGSIFERAMHMIRGESSDDLPGANKGKTWIKTVQERVTEALPEPLRPSQTPPKARKLSLVEKLSGKTVPDPEPPKSTLKKVKEYVTGKSETEEEEMPYAPEVVDEELDDLLTTLKDEEAKQPKDTKHTIANKTRTPKVMRFLGQFVRDDSSATTSVGGQKYTPTPEDEALMSYPSAAARERGKRRYSHSQEHEEAVRAVTAQNETKTMARKESLLASSEAFSKVNNKYRDKNKNSNAKKSDLATKIKALGKPIQVVTRYCPACFSPACPYRRDPGRYLLEVQLAAARYNYVHNPQVDDFLTRRPVLSDYSLLESFRLGIA